MPRESNQRDRIVAGGLLAICIALLLQLLTNPGLDIPLWITLIAISVSVPLLTAQIFIAEIESKCEKGVCSWYVVASGATGVISAFVAVASALWHLLWIASVLFTALSVVALVVVVRYEDALTMANKTQDRGKESGGGTSSIR